MTLEFETEHVTGTWESLYNETYSNEFQLHVYNCQTRQCNSVINYCNYDCINYHMTGSTINLI